MSKHKIRIAIEEIEKKNYHLFVDLHIAGRSCRLLLDTGASKTVFDTQRVLQFVAQKKIKAHESKSVGLGITEMDTQVVKLKHITSGKWKMKSMEAAVLDLSHVNSTYEQIGLPAIDGVLGSDFLMKYKAIIDYEKGILKIKTG